MYMQNAYLCLAINKVFNLIIRDTMKDVEKKEYIEPEAAIIEFNVENSILVDSTRPGYNEGGSGTDY